MNIAESRVYRGPNIWRGEPAIALLLDTADIDETSGTGRVILADRLRQMVPLHERAVSPNERCHGGVGPSECVLQLTRILQLETGVDMGEGDIHPASDTGMIHIVYPYHDEAVGLTAGRWAVRIVSTLASGDDPQSLPEQALEEARSEIRQIAKRSALGPSTAAIVAAAKARGIPVSRPDEKSSFVILGQGHRQRRIWATTTDSTSLVAAYTAADKALVNRLLVDAGIPAPAEIAVEDGEHALRASERIGFPVVIKPLDGNHGRGVTLGVADGESVRAAYDTAARSSKTGRVLVQRQIPGRDYRVLVVGGDVVAVAERIPAHIVGDGTHTILQLVDEVNTDPQRDEGHSSALTRIRTGEQSTAILASQGWTWESVPNRDQRVLLSGAANLSTGGTSVDFTDVIHPANVQLAREAALITGLDVAGIDIVTPDIARSMTEEGGAIVEVNTAPGFRMHTHPAKGRSRPVAEAVTRLLFPAGATGRIPIVAITGTNGKTTTTRMVAHLLRQDGRCVGLTSTDGVYIGDRLAASGDMTGPKSARAVLQHPLVEAAALETARGGILREGLGFDRCDAGIVTNVSADHLGLGGVHTLEDLARVKAVIPASVAPMGASVLNADDPLVMGMIPVAGGEVILFGADEGNPALRNHLGSGGRAAVLARTPSGEMLRFITSNREIDLIMAANIPATMGGLLRINGVNALAAAAAAWALEIPLEVIRAGLASFEAGFATTPGRFNFLEIEGRHVLIDYAHNDAAMRVVGDVVRDFGAPRSVGMVAIPGDRTNEDTIALGTRTGRIFDTLVIREGNARGRPPGESAALIKQGALSMGLPEDRIHIVLDEIEAAHATVDIANPGDLAVIFVTRAGRIWDELSTRAARKNRVL